MNRPCGTSPTSGLAATRSGKFEVRLVACVHRDPPAAPTPAPKPVVVNVLIVVVIVVVVSRACPSVAASRLNLPRSSHRRRHNEHGPTGAAATAAERLVCPAGTTLGNSSHAWGPVGSDRRTTPQAELTRERQVDDATARAARRQLAAVLAAAAAAAA